MKALRIVSSCFESEAYTYQIFVCLLSWELIYTYTLHAIRFIAQPCKSQHSLNYDLCCESRLSLLTSYFITFFQVFQNSH